MAQTTVSSTSVSSAGETVANYRRPLAMVTTLFFMWGFLTSLNDILIPHLKTVFDLNYAKAMLIQFAFFTSYFVFSLPSLASPFYVRGGGVVVVSVDHDAAVRGPTGLVVGDVITAVNDVEVSVLYPYTDEYENFFQIENLGKSRKNRLLFH